MLGITKSGRKATIRNQLKHTCVDFSKFYVKEMALAFKMNKFNILPVAPQLIY